MNKMPIRQLLYLINTFNYELINATALYPIVLLNGLFLGTCGCGVRIESYESLARISLFICFHVYKRLRRTWYNLWPETPFNILEIYSTIDYWYTLIISQYYSRVGNGPIHFHLISISREYIFLPNPPFFSLNS